MHDKGEERNVHLWDSCEAQQKVLERPWPKVGLHSWKSLGHNVVRVAITPSRWFLFLANHVLAHQLHCLQNNKNNRNRPTHEGGRHRRLPFPTQTIEILDTVPERCAFNGEDCIHWNGSHGCCCKSVCWDAPAVARVTKVLIRLVAWLTHLLLLLIYEPLPLWQLLYNNQESTSLRSQFRIGIQNIKPLIRRIKCYYKD